MTSLNLKSIRLLLQRKLPIKFCRMAPERTTLMRKFSSLTIRYLFITLALAISAFAQQPFNRAEFEGRRARLFEKIPDGVAVIFAAKNQFYPVKFRQSPDFYYLTGIEEANAVLVMVGPNKSSIL